MTHFLSGVGMCPWDFQALWPRNINGLETCDRVFACMGIVHIQEQAQWWSVLCSSDFLLQFQNEDPLEHLLFMQSTHCLFSRTCLPYCQLLLFQLLILLPQQYHNFCGRTRIVILFSICIFKPLFLHNYIKYKAPLKCILHC